MAREFMVVRVNPSTYNPGKKKHSAIGKKFDACVRGVRRRGGAYDPEAVCAATMRRKYGQKFQQLSIRARQARARARHNPVQEIVQTHAFGPDHYSVEWVDADDGQWFHSRDLGRHTKIRPPIKPGEHLVAPGALLLIMRHKGAVMLQYTRANFIKHGHHWKYFSPAGQPVHAVANGSKLRITTPHPEKSDVALMETMFAYVKYEEREHSEARDNPRRRRRARPRRPSYARHPADHRRYTAKDKARARKVLGLPAGASQEDVKRAFKTAVMRHHPDLGGDAAKFREAVEARYALADHP